MRKLKTCISHIKKVSYQKLPGDGHLSSSEIDPVSASDGGTSAGTPLSGRGDVLEDCLKLIEEEKAWIFSGTNVIDCKTK